MSDNERTSPDGPDFSQGVPLLEILERGWLAGHVHGEAVIASSVAGEFHAVSATCTHYGAPLSEGLVLEGTVRCPWHHACFDLRTGEALKAPAFHTLQRWKVVVEDDRLFVRGKLERATAESPTTEAHPEKIVIIGGGAAGFAAAEMLRRRGFGGSVTMLSADADPPCDRPNLSKDYLAGTAREEWIPLEAPEFYDMNKIDLVLDSPARRIDTDRRAVMTDDREYPFGALLIATGAEPVRLDTPGFELENVHTLRSLADARKIIASAEGAMTAAVIGASFIGLEVAASLRARGIQVHVVAPDEIPMAKILGCEIGSFIRELHEKKGVSFHLGRTAREFDGERLVLDDASAIAVDFVISGVGVRPRVELAERSGLAVDDGVLVDEFLETSIPGIFAAGDIASYPVHGGTDRQRVEHWVVAERQGQTAALNMLGSRKRYADVPFFWSRHYDTSIHYVGHAATWDKALTSGAIPEGNGTVRFCDRLATRAVASIGQPRESMVEEARLEKMRQSLQCYA